MVKGDLILERFHIGERVGQGGFGVVHRAWDERLERAVAVKEIVAGDEQRVRREAHAAARLNHPGIVALYELGSERSRTYLISELVEGATLRELINERAISDRDVAVVGAELCAALAHAHGRGVVHRDIKPENVIVAAGPSASGGGRGQVKLMDFGIATLAGATTLTSTGQMLGTIAYIAPEQAEGGPTGPEADVYSLGVNLYECWSGENPVSRETPAATARAIGEPVPPLSEARPDIAHRATRIVDACLHPEPDARPTTTELRGSLRELAESLDPDQAVPAALSASEHAPEPAGPGLARVTIPAVLMTAALLAGLTLAGFGGFALALLVLLGPAVLFVQSPQAWLLPALAPALAAVGLSPVYVVVAAVGGKTTAARIALGALGIVWLALLGSLLGLPTPFADLPRASAWVGSAGAAASALRSALSAEVVALALVWALGAATLGAVLSLRVVGLRPVFGLVWAACLLGAYEIVYGTPVAATPVEGGPIPWLLAAAVLGVVVVSIVREVPARRASRPRSRSWGARLAVRQRATSARRRQTIGALRAPERIPGRELDSPVP